MSDKQSIQSAIANIIRNLQGTVSLSKLKDYLIITTFYKFLSDKNLIDEEDKLATILEQSKTQSLTLLLDKTFNRIERKFNNKNISNTLTSFDLDNLELGALPEEKDEKLIKIIESVKNFSLLSNLDLFGYISEYFMSLTSSKSGSANGEYYTPKFVADLLYELALTNKETIEKVYDPTCGSGTLLINFAQHGAKVYGQEINQSSCILCRINLLLHSLDINSFNIKSSCTIRYPGHINERFDVIVSNPPFSVIYNNTSDLLEDERFKECGYLAPRTKGDLMFVLHSIYQLKEDGILMTIQFPGAMYRTGAEDKIRSFLLQKNYIDCVIQLPENIFENTSIPTCLMILKKNRTKNTVRFIDAKSLFEKATKVNVMKDEHIKQILDLYLANTCESKLAIDVLVADIIANNSNLTTNCYIQKEESEKIDIEAVERELERIKVRRMQLEKDIDDLISQIR